MLTYVKTVQRMQELARRRDDRGASAVEYGLLVAAIAAVIVALVFILGGFVKEAFQTTCDEMNTTGTC